MTDNSIGAKLKTLRKGKRWSQQEAADKLGLTRCTVSNYERGTRQPSLQQLKAIANKYGVALDYFGVVSTDEVFDLISRAREVFKSDSVSKEQKEDIYKELMKLYLQLQQD